MDSQRVEEYLEVIYVLSSQGRPRVREIARRLCVKPSSVVEFLRKLSSEGYIIYEKGGRIELTEKGLAVARDVHQRHRLLAEFLESIGVPREIAEEDACRMEHVLHPETVAKIREFLESIHAARHQG
ncbi:metal-dependent transcriptional regulator [Desulfurococcus mucosus]|uniref:Iron (Metal) dependent repressor, DtxR family n=1 Tax=Desulfurococcus mucosus (strain ATCC 35584 / DSM 2162 / JCM 9187 / O7/1) TaxID=765177 RepID=E8R861_DESM0|nr:metal-dependent transcriptional regulator [Desulfurococcus mucosus]ADV64687.1 iron (metal) dependent repressor, DtxR family [Desulfurococcus mucosus DSM 2162]